MIYLSKIFLLVVVVIFTTKAFSFTWITSNGSHFPSEKVTLNVANDNCANAGVSAAQILTLVEKAAAQYWNTVSTANLELVKGSVLSTSFSSFTDGTDSAVLTQAVNAGAANTIIIGCSDKPSTTFSDGFTAAIGGISSGSDTRGAVVINNNDNTFSGLSESQQIAILAHEIGHALGLGHSKDKVAVMYYSVGGKIQEALTRDDWNGLASLYPHESPGSCGTIAFTNSSGPWTGIGSLLIGLMMGLFLMSFSRKNKRTKIFWPS